MGLILSFVIFLFAHATAQAQAACERHSEPEGGFSFCPPEGWEAREVEGQIYKVLVGPQVGEATPNMIVKSVRFDGTLDAFVRGNVAELERKSRAGALRSFKLVGRTEFVTDAGRRGSKIIVQQLMLGNLLRQSFYAFDAGGGRKLVFTCTVLAEGGEQMDAPFDQSMKTLRMERHAGPPKPRPRARR